MTLTEILQEIGREVPERHELSISIYRSSGYNGPVDVFKIDFRRHWDLGPIPLFSIYCPIDIGPEKIVEMIKNHFEKDS